MVLQRAPQSATIFGFDATTEAEVGFQLQFSKSQLVFKLKTSCPEMKKLIACYCYFSPAVLVLDVFELF